MGLMIGAAGVALASCGGVSPWNQDAASSEARTDDAPVADVASPPTEAGHDTGAGGGSGAGGQDAASEAGAGDAAPRDAGPDAGAPPVIVSFTAAPASLPGSGGSVTLSWTVQRAASLSLDTIGPVTGTSLTLMVTATRSFVLTAANPAGMVTATATVTVASDATPPSVVSITPANNALGVAANANIVVRFSEPMNKARTEAAYQSLDLPAANVTFTWDATGTTLTLDPKADLVIAAGTTPGLAAHIYTFTLAGTAEDLAGNKLVVTTSQFRTARRLSLELPPFGDLDGEVDSDGFVTTEDGFNIYVGETFGFGARGFLAYNLAQIPDDALAIEKAEAFAYQAAVEGAPFARLGGRMNLEHVTYNSLTETEYARAPLRAIGVFSTTATIGWRSLVVTPDVADDFTNRVARRRRSQYRLLFPTETTNNDADNYVEIGDSGSTAPYLLVTVLAP